MIMDPKGYEEAVAAVKEMTGPELLRYLDETYGRGNLPRSCMIEDMRAEALAQTERKFGPDYERVLLGRRNSFSSALVPRRDETDEPTNE